MLSLLSPAPMEELALPNTLCKAVDVGDGAAFVAAVAEGEAAYGPVAGLVNNAGCMLLSVRWGRLLGARIGCVVTLFAWMLARACEQSALEKQEASEWDTMINVNIKGVLNGMKAVLGGMKERKAGTVINVSSIAGRAVFDNHAVYCGVKFACTAISEAVRQECCSFGVRVICVEPGVVETPLLSHTTDEAVVEGYKAWKEDGLKSAPLLPEDVARVSLFAFQQPPHVCIREIVIGPTFQKVRLQAAVFRRECVAWLCCCCCCCCCVCRVCRVPCLQSAAGLCCACVHCVPVVLTFLWRFSLP